MTETGPQLGRLAVQKGWLTEAQLAEALELQEMGVARGQTLPFLGEILVKAGYLTPDKVQHLLALQQKRIVQCPGCNGRFNLVGYRPGVKVQCPKCTKTLVLPEKLSRVGVDRAPVIAPKAAPAAPDPLLGRSLGNYKVVSKLGQGGMGAVYKAVQESLDRTVALKVLTADAARSPDFVERFLREAKAAARFNHPNIVQVYDAGHDGDILYFAMEFVDGRSLMNVVEKEGPVHARRAAAWIADAARALAYAHGAGVIHRDVKPDNILVSKEGVVKLADLGLAKTDDAQQNSLTMTGIVMGTPYYMSPEQATDSSKVDARSDIFSLGATFYRIVTGQVPFEGRAPTEILVKIHQGMYKPPSKVKPGLPPELDALVARMMARDAAQRFPDAAQAAAALDRFAKGIASAKTPLATSAHAAAGMAAAGTPGGGAEDTAGAATGESVTLAAGAASSAWYRRRWTLPAGAAATVLVAGLAAAALRNGDDPGTRTPLPLATDGPTDGPPPDATVTAPPATLPAADAREEEEWSRIDGRTCLTREDLAAFKEQCATFQRMFPASVRIGEIPARLESAAASVQQEETRARERARADEVSRLQTLYQSVVQGSGDAVAVRAQLEAARTTDATLGEILDPLLADLTSRITFRTLWREVSDSAQAGDLATADRKMGELTGLASTDEQRRSLDTLRQFVQSCRDSVGRPSGPTPEEARRAEIARLHGIHELAIQEREYRNAYTQLEAAKVRDMTLAEVVDPLLTDLAARIAFQSLWDEASAAAQARDFTTARRKLREIERMAQNPVQQQGVEDLRRFIEEQEGQRPPTTPPRTPRRTPRDRTDEPESPPRGEHTRLPSQLAWVGRRLEEIRRYCEQGHIETAQRKMADLRRDAARHYREYPFLEGMLEQAQGMLDECARHAPPPQGGSGDDGE